MRISSNRLGGARSYPRRRARPASVSGFQRHLVVYSTSHLRNHEITRGRVTDLLLLPNLHNATYVAYLDLVGRYQCRQLFFSWQGIERASPSPG